MEDGINIFLSHTHLDKPIVRRIGNDLESLGMNVWLDEKRIIAGDSISDRIAEGLSEYDVFLIFLSKKSIKAPWVKEELRIAINNRVKTDGKLKIIPVLLEKCEFPIFLEDYLYADFSDSKEYFNAVSFLCDSIVFNDKLFSKYKKYHPGYGLVEELMIEVVISGKNQDIVTIRERHVIKAFKNTNKYKKN